LLPQPSDKNKNVARMGRPGLLLQCAEAETPAPRRAVSSSGAGLQARSFAAGHLDHGFQVGAERGEFDPVGVVSVK